MPLPIRPTTTPVVPPRPVPVAPSPAQVKRAEGLLERAGFNPGPVDGRVTPAFTRALQDFQAAWGLPPSGQLDARTLGRLPHTGQRITKHRDDAFVSIGEKSKAIAVIERRLEKLGYDVGKADGVYSRETGEAVKAFRKDQRELKDDRHFIGRLGRQVLAREVKALQHAPERRRLAPSASQARLDRATAKAAAVRHADGSLGLGLGATGAAAKNVQQHLKAAGFDPQRVDGRVDERTVGALRAFQQRAGLEVTGRVTPKTWAALQKSFILSTKPAGPAQRLGERSAAVKASEKLLKKLGFNPGKVDGLFDRRTQQAVKAFEKKHGLERDGAISTSQLEKLRKAARSGVQVTAEMRRLARTAQRVGLSMGGYTGLGLCATGVSRSIRETMGIQVWGNGNQIDDNLPRSRFRQVHMPLSKALKIPGLVLTWERTSTTLGSRYGHTAITTGNGYTTASDFVERNTLAAGGRSGLKIFVPIR